MFSLPRPRFSRFALLAAALAVAGCTPHDGAVTRDGFFDPYEENNRATHRFNRALDRALVRPASGAYGGAVPTGLRDNVSNFAQNLSTPGMAVNHLLQGDLRGSGINLYRFVINSTFGIGGIIDAAGAFGVTAEETDFGETLHVWGAPEGAYLELPVLGPSTERDAVGKLVDLFTNPLSYTLPSPERHYARAARVAKRLGDRGRYGDTVDSILYDSADSYAQARMIYLQSRRFELGGDMDALYTDPYSTDGGTAGADSDEAPYADPYADPYAE